MSERSYIEELEREGVGPQTSDFGPSVPAPMRPPGSGLAGPNDGFTIMEGGGIPGISYPTPIIGDPNITNKVQPIQQSDPMEDYRRMQEELANAHYSEGKPLYNANLVQDDSDLAEVIF